MPRRARPAPAGPVAAGTSCSGRHAIFHICGLSGRRRRTATSGRPCSTRWNGTPRTRRRSIRTWLRKSSGLPPADFAASCIAPESDWGGTPPSTSTAFLTPTSGSWRRLSWPPRWPGCRNCRAPSGSTGPARMRSQGPAAGQFDPAFVAPSADGRRAPGTAGLANAGTVGIRSTPVELVRRAGIGGKPRSAPIAGNGPPTRSGTRRNCAPAARRRQPGRTRLALGAGAQARGPAPVEKPGEAPLAINLARQFSVGFCSRWSITVTGMGRFCASSFRPSSFSNASKRV